MDRTVIITTSSFGKFDQSPLQFLETKFDRIILNPFGRKLTEEEILRLIKEYQPIGIIAGVETLTKEVLKEAKNLLCISRAGIGIDNVDLQASHESGIAVRNTPDAPTIPVAELTVGMMLSLLRLIHRSDQGLRKGDWIRPMGQQLQGKTVGLIGCGRIGQYVADLLTPFGCKILGYDPDCSEHKHISFTQLETLLRCSDIISLHLPYTAETHHIINAETLDLIPKDAYLINTSRGGLVDEHALFAALNSGKLAGTAIDCFEVEPYTGPLIELDNVLLTGHIGAYAMESRIFMEKQSVENLIDNLERKGVF